jgi:hypothetical protein
MLLTRIGYSDLYRISLQTLNGKECNDSIQRIEDYEGTVDCRVLAGKLALKRALPDSALLPLAHLPKIKDHDKWTWF